MITINKHIEEGLALLGGEAVTVNATALVNWLFEGDANASSRWHKRLNDLRADLEPTDGQMILIVDRFGAFTLIDDNGNLFRNPPAGSFCRFTREA